MMFKDLIDESFDIDLDVMPSLEHINAVVHV